MVTIASLAIIAFAGTFLMHSIACLVPALWFARRKWVQPRVRATVLLIAAVLPIITASASISLDLGFQLNLPRISIEEDHIVRRSIDEAGRVVTTESGGLTLASKIAIGSIAFVAIALMMTACVQTARTMLRRQRAIRDFGLRSKIDSSAWLHVFREIVQRRKTLQTISLTHAPHLSSPIALASEVCIPSAWISRSNEDESRVVLAHEIEHVVWRDPQTLALLDFLRRSLLWQPLLTLAMKEFAELVEESCDAAAVQCTGDAQSVARVLLSLATMHPQQIAFTQLNSGRAVRHRIERIVLSPTSLQHGAGIGFLFVATLTVLTACLPHIASPRRDVLPNIDVQIESVSPP